MASNRLAMASVRVRPWLYAPRIAGIDTTHQLPERSYTTRAASLDFMNTAGLTLGLERGRAGIGLLASNLRPRLRGRKSVASAQVNAQAIARDSGECLAKPSALRRARNHGSVETFRPIAGLCQLPELIVRLLDALTAIELGQSRAEVRLHDPQVMGGRPCISGQRMTVGTIVGLFAAGKTAADILAAYPHLELNDINAALAYAAWRAKEGEPPIAR